MAVDLPLMILFGILVLAGGISFGMLYRGMQRKEEQLSARAQNAEGELRAMLTMTDDAVLLLDSLGTVRAVNPAAEELFGRSEDDFEGDEISQFLQQPLQLAELTRNGPANLDATAIRPGGESVNVELLISQVQHGHRITYLALVHEKQAGASAVANLPDLNKAISKHCHDLNNQLTGVIGHISLILMSAETTPAIHERLMSAKKNTLRAQETSRKLHSIARSDSPESLLIDAPAPAPGTIVPMPIASPNQAAASTGTPATPRVLILDDEEAICALVSAVLSAQGVEVTEATGSAQALQACEQAVKNGRPFDLVIADFSLPNDLNGPEIVERLRAIAPSLKAVISSGHDKDEIMVDYRRYGFDAALAKPYELHKLGRIVREILESNGSGSRKTA